jgi:hypothetical protein
MELRIRMGPPGERWKTEVRLGLPEQRDGHRRQLFRQIDRRADLYREIVWDSATGEIFHQQDHAPQRAPRARRRRHTASPLMD